MLIQMLITLGYHRSSPCTWQTIGLREACLLRTWLGRATGVGSMRHWTSRARRRAAPGIFRLASLSIRARLASNSSASRSGCRGRWRRAQIFGSLPFPEREGYVGSVGEIRNDILGGRFEINLRHISRVESDHPLGAGNNMGDQGGRAIAKGLERNPFARDGAPLAGEEGDEKMFATRWKPGCRNRIPSPPPVLPGSGRRHFERAVGVFVIHADLSRDI